MTQVEPKEIQFLQTTSNKASFHQCEIPQHTTPFPLLSSLSTPLMINRQIISLLERKLGHNRWSVLCPALSVTLQWHTDGRQDTDRKRRRQREGGQHRETQQMQLNRGSPFTETIQIQKLSTCLYGHGPTHAHGYIQM